MYQEVRLLIILTATFLAFSCHQQNKEIDKSRFEFLINCYPDFLIEVNDSVIKWKNGEAMQLDDKLVKSYGSLLNYPDFEDQFCFTYQLDSLTEPPVKYYDPGRIRYEPFFKRMYGNSKEEVERNLVDVIWLPSTINKKIRVTKINGVNIKLQQVSNELDKLPPIYKEYLKDIGGTFNWRTIKDTDRLSSHSFGIAIDINVAKSDYWKWSKEDTIKYRNRIPYRIVKIFEKHGFIWGGKWYHYDTMHFEYRPEIIAYAKSFRK